jgi:hypothetical protein
MACLSLFGGAARFTAAAGRLCIIALAMKGSAEVAPATRERNLSFSAFNLERGICLFHERLSVGNEKTGCNLHRLSSSPLRSPKPVHPWSKV